MTTYPKPLVDFVVESNWIENITREPTEEELSATWRFAMSDKCPTLAEVIKLQAVYAPGYPLRDKGGMNVRVGRYVAPLGGPTIAPRLRRLLSAGLPPYDLHVQFELLHPFMDGNGRTGRALWARALHRQGRDPFHYTFLRGFYYETLARAG